MVASRNTRSRTKSKLAGGSLLERKDHVLLKNSEAVKAIPGLKELLENHSRITAGVLEELPMEEQKIFHAMKPELVKQAAGEWIGEFLPEDDLEDERIACSLCGTDNKLVFIIENKLNKIRLNVGSTCIQFFGIKINEEEKSIAEYRRVNERFRRKAMLSHALSNPGLIDKWDDTEKYPIILPKALRAEFDKVGVEFQTLCDKYMAKKCENEIFSRLNQAIENREKYLKDFDDYVAKNSNKPFIITSEYYRWAQDHFPKDCVDWRTWIDRMEREGYINWGIAAHLANVKFATKLIEPLNGILKGVGAIISDFDRNNKVFNVKLTQENNIILEIPFFDMIQNFGGPIFKPDYLQKSSMALLIANAKVSDYKSIDKIIMRLGDRLRSSGFHVEEEDKTSGELLIFRKDVGKYVKTNRQNLANKFIAEALDSVGVETMENIINYIKALPGKLYTLEDLKEAADFERQMRHKDY
ncbi:MAG: hypothetical protein H6Q76_2645 [Firmicutes bacterium]|nr:hypothetical protein [Bacillota bacterium]